MKRFLIVLAAVAVFGVLYVAAAPGSQQAGPTAKQFRALKKQVAALTSKVTELKGTVSDLQETVSDEAEFLDVCFSSAWPISEYGDWEDATFGYDYTDDGITYFNTTALDFDDSGTPDVWLLGVNASCVGASTSGSAGRHLAMRHAVVHAGRH